MESEKDTSLKSRRKGSMELTVIDEKEKQNGDVKKKKAMRQGCLGLFDCCFSTDSSSEQTPISGKMEDGGKRMYDSSLLSDPDDKHPLSEEKAPMTILRKILFVLSLNGGVVYIAVLLWFIPCRLPPCTMEHEWDYNTTSMLTSNIEMSKVPGRSSSLLFCHADASGGHVSSLNMSDGTLQWNRTLSSFCRYVFCDFDPPLEVNKRRICITTGYDFIGALDATNGDFVWRQNRTSPSGETIHRVASSDVGGYPRLLGISENYIFSLNAVNGTVESVAKLPCDSALDVRLAGPWKSENGTLWAVVCLAGDSTAVWTFEEGDVLRQEGSPRDDDVGFGLLFSRGSWSMDVAGDVTTTPESLAVAWADSVAMVTAAQRLLLHETWERRFDGGRDYLAVTSMVFGHFTNPKENQLAVAVQDGSNMTIHILETNNGSSVAVSGLGHGRVLSLERISGRRDETDTLLVEAVQDDETKAGSSTTHIPEQTTRSYLTVRYSKKSVMYQTLTTADVYDSTFSSLSEGAADLITATKTPEGTTTLRRIVITIVSGGPFCNAGGLKNTTIVITQP